MKSLVEGYRNNHNPFKHCKIQLAFVLKVKSDISLALSADEKLKIFISSEGIRTEV